MKRNSLIATALATAGMMLATAGASASQGPGTGPGALGGTVQTGMAILVYGTCAATITFGLLGALRRR